ncbi:hypothetical protein WH50_11225 [Pokkaliibacter plantistimulans]|uniref:DUF3108 domain-containing protein n=2 Tax=Pokkaliibacter plantistimulans TaxID=1635171 RepID=A0ABX5M156_9GAMM|nr:hypothetical protein WH50_11225 [Pokkaliibacter plantistimulans]
MRDAMLKKLWAPFLLAFGLHSHAATLKPFEAHYSAEIDAGITVGASAVRSLQQTADGHWILSIRIENALASLDESTEFRLQNGAVQPLHYEFLRKVLGKKRSAVLDFDWEQKRVHNNVQDKPWHMEIPEHTQDKLSYQAQLLLDLENAVKQYKYDVATGGKLDSYVFENVGTEQIKTPAGTFETIKLKRVRESGSDRETLIWLAPELDYQIVQLQQVEKDDKTYRLVLKSLN